MNNFEETTTTRTNDFILTTNNKSYDEEKNLSNNNYFLFIRLIKLNEAEKRIKTRDSSSNFRTYVYREKKIHFTSLFAVVILIIIE